MTKPTTKKRSTAAKPSTKTTNKKTTAAAAASALASKKAKATKTASQAKKTVPAKTAKASQKASSQVAKTASKVSLFTANKWLTLFYAAQAVAVAMFAKSHLVDLNTSYLTKDGLLSTSNDLVLGSATQVIASFSLGWTLAIMLALAAIFHGLLATKLRPHYEAQLANGQNAYRWVSLALFGGYLLTVFALLLGGNNLNLIVLLLVAAAGAAVVGHQSKGNKSLLVVSTVLGAGSTLAVAGLIGAAYLYGGSHLPLQLQIAAGSGLFVAALLVTNTWLQHAKKGPWADFIFGERWFLIGNFILLSAVTWQLFAGLLW